MKKLTPKTQKYLAKIDAQINRANEEFYAQEAKIRIRYNMDKIEDLDEDEQREHDEWWEYMSWFSEYSADHEIQTNKLYAQRAAAMLIGYNIAHRGKKLHEKTLLKKTAKMGDDGAFIRAQMHCSRFDSCFVTDRPYLHQALLKNYGVTLLDSNYLDYLETNLIDMVFTRDIVAKEYPNKFSPDAIKRLNNRIDKYERTLNLFHKTMVHQGFIRNTAAKNFNDEIPF